MTPSRILRRAQITLRSAERVEKELRDRLDRVIQTEILKTERSLAIRSLAYAPDGRTLASADGRGFIRVWNPANGDAVVEVGRHPQAAHRVNYSPDGRFIASAGDDETIILWDPSGKGERLRLSGRSEIPPCFSFSPDGQAFAYQAVDAVRVINLETRQNLTVFTDVDWVWGLAFAPDGRTLAGTNPSGLWAWDLTPAPEQTALSGHRTEVQAVAVSPDGTIASGDIDGRVLLWGPSGGLAAELTGEQDHKDIDFTSHGVGNLVFSPSGRLVVSKTDQGVATVWDVVTGCARARLGTLSDDPLTQRRRAAYDQILPRNTLVFSQDGQLLATTSGSGKISVWDTRTWKELRLEGLQQRPLALGFGVAATTIVAVYDTGEISRWDLITHERTQLPAIDPVVVAAFSPDGKTLAVARGSSEGITAPALSVLDLATGHVLAEFKGVSEPLKALAFSPDGRRIAAAGSGGTVAVWDATSGDKALNLAIAPLTGRVNSVAFTRDGSTIITAGPHTAAYRWDAATGEQQG